MNKKIHNRLQHLAILLLGTFLIIASGGGGGDENENPTPTPTPPPTPTILTGSLSFLLRGNNTPVNGVSYTTSSSASTSNKTTGSSNRFTYIEGETIQFTINGVNYSTTAKASILFSDLISNPDQLNNLKQLVLHMDTDDSDGTVTLNAETTTLDASLSRDDFLKAFYKLTGSTPEPLFTPSLGVNLEAPQAESSLAGQPMPFVDIYRTARPFVDRNYNNASIQTTVDSNGWPTGITPGGAAQTKLLEGAIPGSIPSGNYTLIYEGSGFIGFSSNVVHTNLPSSLLADHSELKGRSIEIGNTPTTINIVINEDQLDVKNIRVIMPGGTCKNNSTNEYNHSIHVYSQDDCPAGFSYISFVERLIADRNTIIFNPEYLAFLKDFKSLRMMNFMEATPGQSTCINDGIVDNSCIDSDQTIEGNSQWESRAKMDHAVWGGSSNTPINQRKGVPVEVLVELANQTKTNPWFTMPHYADDDYIINFATYVKENLDSSLKVYLEYSNEVSWNPGFVAFHYSQKKGIEAGYNTVPSEFSGIRDANYFARLRYYAQRSIEISTKWTDNTGFDSARLIRVAGSFQGDTILSSQILNYDNGGHFDVLAIAPYFLGCTNRDSGCSNATKILPEVTTVDDIFDIIDAPATEDPSALASTIKKIANHSTIATSAGVKLVSYEGGQHLTITLGDIGSLSETEKMRILGLFQEANRDSRMKDRYIKLLNAWKETDATTLFTLYTLPQSYYRYGNWGLKEHLGQQRADAPKYDGTMTFQETVGQCWWDDCS